MNPYNPASSQYGSGWTTTLTGPSAYPTMPIYNITNAFTTSNMFNRGAGNSPFTSVADNTSQFLGSPIELVNIPRAKGVLYAYSGSDYENVEDFTTQFEAWAVLNNHAEDNY